MDREDWLKRRLQTVLFSKKLVNTSKQARQLITHKHVSVGAQIVNIPSYQVSLEEEPEVKLNIVLKIKEPTKSKVEEIKEKVLDSKNSEPEVLENKETPSEEVIAPTKPVQEVNKKPIEVEAK